MKEFFGELLIKKGLITQQQLDDALQEQKKINLPLGLLLVRKGIITEEQLLSALSEKLGIEYIKIEDIKIDVNLTKEIPAKLVTHYKFFPIRVESNNLVIAVSDPLDLLTIDEIKLALKRELKLLLATQEDITKAIRRYYGLGAETVEGMMERVYQEVEFLPAETVKEEDIQDIAIDPSVIKFINQVFLAAIKDRATDIHFEPFENELRIRYRIDGVLYDVSSPPTIKHFQKVIASRLKVMANLDIAEKRLPQDGRVKIKMGQEVFDLRISFLPTPFGESIEIRILPRTTLLLDLKQLGLLEEELELLNWAINKPYGIILVTGPTGSGKTTTLYACLSKINSPERKILTIEDPIEYQLKGIIQMQVEPKIGFTFANALRSMLRHDPDAMMIGEIRDFETAELAIRTALTGHLVFSTLHTNDASGAIPRLSDVGVESYLVSSSLLLVIAQRLVRVICPKCKERVSLPAQTLENLDFPEAGDVIFFRGKGCSDCRFTGYRGRTGIFEILRLNEKIRKLINEKASSDQIRQAAISSGMKTLRQAGWEKVKGGITTLEEVLRVTQEER
jgi:type IV-A pilus assembly ATPase PilB